ncbi:MAG: cyclase family protein [Planctomycetes bacterium]|nr:cyclase family protein [Planctomycetota bacterium]
MKLIDLTMPLNARTPLWPGDPKPEFRQLANIRKDGYTKHLISLNTHFGTHIDAPWHMLAKGRKLTEFPLRRFIGTAKLFNVKGQKEIDIPLARIRRNDIVLLRTDHSRKAYDADYFRTNPVISRKLAEGLARKGIGIIGLDSCSPDNAPFDLHKIFFRKDILILENLVNLDKIHRPEFTIYIMPIKYDRIDGAPCRVIARLGAE